PIEPEALAVEPAAEETPATEEAIVEAPAPATAADDDGGFSPVALEDLGQQPAIEATESESEHPVSNEAVIETPQAESATVDLSSMRFEPEEAPAVDQTFQESIEANPESADEPKPLLDLAPEGADESQPSASTLTADVTDLGAPPVTELASPTLEPA